ncbi:MAG: hypothetical protein ACI837_000656 [Crocinitomicaceae bacterium]|jgi:hypothetical protein
MRFVKLLLVGSLLSVCTNVHGQADCDELIHYRDVELAETWDGLHKQVLFSERQLADYEEWKTDLDGDYTGVSVGTLLSAIKGVSNLITNTYELVTPTGKVISIAKIFNPATIDKIETFKAINKNLGEVETLYNDGIVGLMKRRVVEKMGFFGSLYTKVNDLVSDLEEFDDFNESRNEIKAMLRKFDQLIDESQELVEKSMDDIKEFNDYVNYITAYLVENCD